MDERGKLSKKIALAQAWQWICLLPGLVSMTPFFQPIGVAQARNVALLRAWVLLGGFVLLLILQMVKSRCRLRLAKLESSSIAINNKPPIPPPF